MANPNLIPTIYNQIRSKILLTGPITVAEYMKAALTSPSFPTTSRSTSPNRTEGYYMHRDVFGQHGDFTTSPEITQLFGEIVGVWGIDTWRRIGGPKKLNIVELGPGRGTLAKDVLRVFGQLKTIENSVNLHLVEISPHLVRTQFQTLCGNNGDAADVGEAGELGSMNESIDAHFHEGRSNDAQRVPVFWHRDLRTVPKEFNFYIAHEFFDALPIHKLRRVNDNWREVLVDVESPSRPRVIGKEEVGTDDNQEKFRFVISRHETPIIQLLKSQYQSVLNDTRLDLEFSLEAAHLYDQLTQRLERDGGMALIIDYGHEGTKGETFRAFHRHKLHDPLERPGYADLTADVDFSIVKKLTQTKALVCGPITQTEFLARSGVGVRLSNLYRNCKTDEERKQLVSGCKMVMEDMGTRFKCLALFPKILEEFRPKLKITAFDD